MVLVSLIWLLSRFIKVCFTNELTKQLSWWFSQGDNLDSEGAWLYLVCTLITKIGVF